MKDKKKGFTLLELARRERPIKNFEKTMERECEMLKSIECLKAIQNKHERLRRKKRKADALYGKSPAADAISERCAGKRHP